VYDELGEEGLKTQWEVGVRGKTASEVRCFLALRREEGRNGKKRFATSPEREHCQRWLWPLAGAGALPAHVYDRSDRARLRKEEEKVNGIRRRRKGSKTDQLLMKNFTASSRVRAVKSGVFGEEHWGVGEEQGVLLFLSLPSLTPFPLPSSSHTVTDALRHNRAT
jgi:hypothetical protein